MLVSFQQVEARMDLGRKLILHGLVVGLLASFVVACGGDSPVIGEDVSGSPGDVSTVDVPSAETAGVPETVALSGTVIAATSLAPLSNASVCIEATCVASDSDGGFVLEVPPGTVTLQVEASGYRTAATVVDTSTDPWVTVPMVSEQLWSEQQIGAGLNGATGILARFVTTDGEGGAVPLAGVTVQLAGYAGMGSLYQLGGLAGPGGATGADGQGLFIDVSAGSYTIVSSHPGGACMPSYGTMDGGLTVVALADVVTVVSFQCVVVESDRVGLSGAVTSHQTGASMMAVEVCFHPADQQEATCTYTGPDGTYGFNDLPPDAAGTLMVTAAGFYPSRTPLNTGSGRVVPVVVSAAGVPRMTVAEPFDPAEQGIAVMTAYDNVSVVDGDLASSTLLAGVSLGLKPGAGLGPYYLAEPGLYSPIAPATFDAGEGVILNLPVGTYAAAFEHPWGNCWPGNGLAYEADGAFTFEVEAGVETRLVALCDAAVPETATIIGRLVNGLSLPDPLEGGTVCLVEKNTTTGEYEESMCATADENGDYELSGVPANTEIRLRSTSPGYDINDYILNSHFGLTHESRLTPSVMKQYIWNPIVEAGKCEDVEDINTYGGKAFFTTRIYDAAYNSDTFYQGLWTWRGKVHVEPLDGPDDSSMTMLYFDDYLVNTELDESTHSNGGVMTCAIEPGFYRIRYTHPGVSARSATATWQKQTGPS